MGSQALKHDPDASEQPSEASAPVPPGVGARVLHEAREALAPTLFFFVGFNFIVFTTNLLLADYGAAAFNFMVATVGALVVGKAVLVANAMPYIRRYDRAPLVRPILFKTIFYAVIVFLARLLERFVHYSVVERNPPGDFPAYLMTTFSWNRFAAINLWIMVLFLIYVTASEGRAPLWSRRALAPLLHLSSDRASAQPPTADPRAHPSEPAHGRASVRRFPRPGQPCAWAVDRELGAARAVISAPSWAQNPGGREGAPFPVANWAIPMGCRRHFRSDPGQASRRRRGGWSEVPGRSLVLLIHNCNVCDSRTARRARPACVEWAVLTGHAINGPRNLRRRCMPTPRPELAVGGADPLRMESVGRWRGEKPSHDRREDGMATYVLARRAALVALGVWAVAGLSGCNTAPTPAVQSTASGFRIGSIQVNTAPLVAQSGNPTASWAQQALPGQLARSFAPVMAPGDPTGATLNVRIDFDLPGRGRGRRPRPNERLGDAERRRGADPHHARAGDRGIHFQPGRSIVAGAGLAGQGAGSGAVLRVLAGEEIAALSP